MNNPGITCNHGQITQKQTRKLKNQTTQKAKKIKNKNKKKQQNLHSQLV